MDVRLAAKYPFLKEATGYLKDSGITLDSLTKSVAYERARFMGKERVMEAVESGMVDDHSMASAADANNELLSYPVARMIVSAVADPMLVNRYAIAEAKKADERLRGEDLAFIKRVAEELGLDVVVDGGTISVDFTAFLRFSATMRSKDWKLVNQQITHGRVVVTKHRLVRLIQQMLTDKISSELPLPVNDDIMLAFSADISEIGNIMAEKRAEFKARSMGRVSIIRFPPCMKKMLKMIQDGENLPHSGRFALVSFLHKLGMNSDEVLETFSSAPDFDESKSRYQIQHITGEISGTEYTPPECSTMKSYGICFDPDSLCKREWMTHPLTYYKAKGKRFKKPSGK
ncbi:MAG: primase large subunit PriL [Candidatus Thermoplasmatota archaeon]|nr:primase large subunit PriL [Candidatus Thermoplasmatota archaeon]